jgi:hypothetical protein
MPQSCDMGQTALLPICALLCSCLWQWNSFFRPHFLWNISQLTTSYLIRRSWYTHSYSGILWLAKSRSCVCVCVPLCMRAHVLVWDSISKQPQFREIKNPSGTENGTYVASVITRSFPFVISETRSDWKKFLGVTCAHVFPCSLLETLACEFQVVT